MGKVLISATAVVLTAAGISGCGSDSRMMSSDGVPMVQTIPAEGERMYDPSAPIYLTFSEAVDTGQFHNSFYCMEDSLHNALHDSLSGGMMGDSASHGEMGGHGSMGGMMQDMMGGGMMGNHQADTSEFYQHLHDRSLPGHFGWNADGDSCVFTPNEALLPDHNYVLMFRSDMRNRHGGRLRHMGGMMTQDLMLRFHTQ